MHSLLTYESFYHEKELNLSNAFSDLWKPVWSVLKKLKIELSYDPVIPILGIYPKEWKSESQVDMSTLMFIHNTQDVETT